MQGSPSKSCYKWWESDDKTKRLYTELLAEKIAKSPKKTPNANCTLTRSLSSCSDLRSRIQALEHQGSPPNSPLKRVSSIKSLVSSEESDSSQKGHEKKYTFETVTMDTLAKYEYIKSPKKKHLGSKDLSSSSSSSSSPSLSSSSSSSIASSVSSSPSPPTSGSDEEYEKMSFSMQKLYDPKENTPREATGVHSNQTGEHKIKSWAWSNNESTSKSQDRWGLSSKDNTRPPTTPTKSCFSPKSSPRLTSLDSDAWMKPNPMFMLMTSSQKPELKSFGFPDNNKTALGTQTRTNYLKESILKSKSKLDEVPEYKTSSSEDDTDNTYSDRSSGYRANSMSRTFKKDSKETSGHDTHKLNFKSESSIDEKSGGSEEDDKSKTRVLNSSEKKENNKSSNNKGKVKFNPVDKVDGEIDVNQIAKRFQSLCEEVEQLEFKMFEFSDDLRKLKIGIGLKDEDTDSNNNAEEFKHHFKHTFPLTVGKDLLSERATAGALLMRQYSSPSKSPRSVAKLLQDTGIDKEMAEADSKRSHALEVELRKIKEKELTEGEIHDVLRSAKSKYIDRPNYLEDIGFSIRSQREKG